MTRRLFRAALAVPVVAMSAFAADADPTEQLATFKVAEGFEVSLFASEKDGIIKPIQMRWDERGRLWVIGSQTYPQVKPGEEPNDKVWILEDTNRDGKADKTTVFADGLMIPTGIEIAPPVEGVAAAAYIGEGTKLWLMSDLDGDGRADRREIVLRGFGTGDNHQNLNSFRWSPSGELMFCQGLHAFSSVETPWGITRLDEAGFFRFRPRTMELDAFYGGKADPQNPWGWVWTRGGQPILVAGNNGTMFYPFPEMIRGWQGGRRDSIWDGKGRKTSGPDMVETTHFPEAWQGAMIAGGYINNAVWTLKIEEDGAGFRIVDHPSLPPLVQSTHGAFRPVDVKFGPDGALYVCDWFNPIIGHYQASFRHPDRDKAHGRIWRIRAKDRPSTDGVAAIFGSAKPPARPELQTLLGNLLSTDRWVREQSKRLLYGGNSAEVTAALRDWIGRRDPLVPSTELAMIDALGIFAAHEVIEPGLLEKALQAKNPDARAFAATILARWANRLPIEFPAVEALSDLAHDEHPRVRLAAIVAAGNIPRQESIIPVLAAAERPRDKTIDLALRAAVAVLRPHWEKADQSDWKPAWRDLLVQLSGDAPKRMTASIAQPAPPKPAPTAAIPVIPAHGKLRATPEFVRELVEEVRTKGDAANGAKVYARAELACTSCHKIGNQGTNLGPTLDSIGSAQPLDFIIGAVLEPQREVKEGFETFAFSMKDGRMIVGTIVAGTNERFTVRDAGGNEHALTAAQVAERKMIGSLMPAGLVDQLSREDLRDLFRFLSELGKAK